MAYKPAPENFLKGKKILEKACNWVSFCEDNDDLSAATNPIRYIHFDYTKKRWYEYKYSGPVDCPNEDFVGWVD